MSAHVLLNLLNKLGKRDKMRGLSSIVSCFRNEFGEFNKVSRKSVNHYTYKDQTCFLRLLKHLLDPEGGVEARSRKATVLTTPRGLADVSVSENHV